MTDEAFREKVMDRLSYDATTGSFVWKMTIGPVRAGQPAGIVTPGGYRRISVDGRLYTASRLAWLILYGCWPTLEIDHINGIRDDNRVVNLREVTTSTNSRNRKVRTDNSHGVPGVYFNPARNRWYAQSCHGGKNKHLGNFPSFEAAAAARADFQKLHGYHPNHGRSGTQSQRST